jgi:uncharacterized protein YjdB
MRTRFYMFICISLMGCLLAGCDEDVKKDALEKYIYVNKSSLDMYIGDEVQLTASPVGESFTWSSENAEVAGVSQTGLVKALSEGVSSIAVNGELKVDVRVRTFIPLTDISLTATEISLMAKLSPGSTLQFRAAPLPSNTTAEFSPVWTSSNTGVATVSETGLLTAHAAGTTILTVTSGDISKSLEITVIPVMSEEDLFREAKAYWQFDDPSDMTKASAGSPLIRQGDGFTFVEGPSAGNGAVQVAKGSYFRALHATL